MLRPVGRNNKNKILVEFDWVMGFGACWTMVGIKAEFYLLLVVFRCLPEVPAQGA